MNYIITDIKEDVMRNKRILAISAIAISASVFMAACSFGGGNPDESVAVSVTPTPVATETPAPTATIAPNVQATTYTSADKSVAINLPNATWANKTDEADTLSFESPDEGKILILHGQGADTMASTVIPSTQDMATSLEQADGDKVDGTDFEIQDYTSTDVNGIGVYTYTTKMLNTEKSNGSLYVIHKVIANDSEYYSIEASVNKEDVLSAVKSSVDSFQILGDSSLKKQLRSRQQLPLRQPTMQTQLLLMQTQMQQTAAQQQILLRQEQTAVQPQIQQEAQTVAATDPKAMAAPVIPALQQFPTLQDSQMSSFPTQMRQEPSIVILTDIRL